MTYSTQASSLVNRLTNTQQDFEWYPTTQEIIDLIRVDMDEYFTFGSPSVLDCGAGDGRVLHQLTDGTKYAIEKSTPLLNIMDRSIFVVGTEFREQTLIDKRVDVLFSNPPYSEFADWAEKIIAEAHAPLVYLVIPKRWNNDVRLKHAIEQRRAETKILGEFDFANAERKARAVVNIVRIDLGYGHRSEVKTDPFKIWFDNNFKFEVSKAAASTYEREQARKGALTDRVQNALVDGSDILSVLVELYEHDLGVLADNYRALSELDHALLLELDVSVEALMSALKQRIEGLKNCYWQELFDRLDKITERLTHESRTRMLECLTAHTHVDFTKSNAQAILGWVLKNANNYFDDQLVSLVERMTEKGNIDLYTSNQRTFGDEDWRYCRQPQGLSHYGLDLRVVLHRIGGLCITDFRYDYERFHGLEERAFWFIHDLVTVANNLGFKSNESPRSFEWVSNGRQIFHFRHPKHETEEDLMSIKAFKNGNLHIKLNQDFLCRLNVEFGRLKGWIKSPRAAADELDIGFEDAVKGFESNVQLGAEDILMLPIQVNTKD